MLQKYDFTKFQNDKPTGIIPVARVRAIKPVPAQPEDKPLYVWLSPWGLGDPEYIMEPLTIFPYLRSSAKYPAMLVPGEDIFVERRLIEDYLKDGSEVPDELCDAIDNLILYEIHVHRDRWLATQPVVRGAL